MARTPFSFNNMLLRQNPRTIQNPNHPFRNIGIGGNSGNGEEFIQNKDKVTLHHDEHQNFTEIAKEVSRIIRTRPRWEQTLVADFPTVNFLSPNIFLEVLKHQNNAFLSLRFFYWLSSHHGFEPDQSLCNLIFVGLVEAKTASAARDFLSHTKFSPDPACLEAYIQCLCENGLVVEALNVFGQLKRLGSCPSLATWNSALLGSVRAGRADVVWKLYGDMMECGVVADVDTIEYLIQAFCIDDSVLKGYELIRQLLEDGHVPSKFVFNKLIYGFCKDKNYAGVSSILHIMIAKNLTPDIYTYQEIIHGLCKQEMQHEAFRIFNDLKDRGYALDRVMYTTMIHGLCKMKWLGDARKLWFEMIQKGINPSEYTLNTIISGLCSDGRTEEAHVLFKQMAGKGITCDVTTYNSLIRGFCEEGKIAEGMNLLYELLKQGLQPSTVSYIILIAKLYKLGHWVEAKTLWKYAK